MTLHEWLKTEGVTPAEFAKDVGVSRVSVYRWLSGTRRPSLPHQAEIYRKTKRKVSGADWAGGVA